MFSPGRYCQSGSIPGSSTNPTLQQEVTIMEKIITITLGVALIVSNALPGPIELTLILYAAFAMAVGYGLRNIPRLYKELKAV